MSEVDRALCNRQCGLAALSVIHLNAGEALVAPDAPRVYVCMKDNVTPGADDKNLSGRHTSAFFLGIGLHRAAELLNCGLAHCGFEYVVTPFGIEVKPTDLVAANIFLLGLADLGRSRPPFVIKDEHLPLVDSLGARSRKAVLDSVFASGADLHFSPEGHVIMLTPGKGPEMNMWLTMCVGSVLRGVNSGTTIRSCVSKYVTLVNWLQPRWVLGVSGWTSKVINRAVDVNLRDPDAHTRILVSADSVTRAIGDGLWSARLNKALLARAGDVEVNPGPPFRRAFIVLALCFVAIHIDSDLIGNALQSIVDSDVWLAPNPIAHLFDTWVTLPCERTAFACAVIDRENEFWLHEYNNVRFIQVAKWLGTVPSPADLRRTSWQCKVAYFSCGKPDVPDFVGPSFLVWAKFLAKIWVGAAVFGLATLSCAVALSVIWIMRKRGKVVVVNRNGAIDVNYIRRSLNIKAEQPKTLGTGHEWLAKQRKSCEGAVVELMLKMTSRFRDVGGSRSRWPELGRKKHLCCPTLSNDDVLRELKSEDIFDNCYKRGEDCPLKQEVPFALMTHVDYHMSQDAMVRTITGPTFIINHDFRAKPTRLGVVGKGAEAELTYFGGNVTMTTRDGTKYQHGYHLWDNEGSVVTDSGAFVYTKLTTFYDTSIYFAYPADGVYSRNDVNCMPPDSDDSLPMINGYVVHKDYDAGCYKFSKPGHEFETSANLIEECSISFAAAPRDTKYVSSLLSYVTSRARSVQVDTANIDTIVLLIGYLADVKATTTVYAATCVQGHPVDFHWYDLYRVQFLIWLRHRSLSWVSAWASRIIDSTLAQRCTAWTFPKIIVPTYEIYTRMNRSVFITTQTGTFGNDRFQSPPSPANARSDEHPQRCTGEDTSEHDHLTRDAGFKLHPKTKSSVNQHHGTRSGRDVHDRLEPTAPPWDQRSEQVDPLGGHWNALADDEERRHYDGPDRTPRGPTTRDKHKTSEHVPAKVAGPIRPDEDNTGFGPAAEHCFGSTFCDGANQCLTVETSSSGRKDTVSRLDRSVSDAIRAFTDTEADRVLTSIDAVLGKLSRLGITSRRAGLVEFLCKAAVGFAGPERNGVFDLPGGSLLLRGHTGAHRRDVESVDLRELVVEIHPEPTSPISEGPRSGGQARMAEERPHREKFSKDRGKRHRRRSEEHQSTK